MNPQWTIHGSGKYLPLVQLTDIAQVQEHVGAGWVILSIANGQHPDLSAYQLFALGKYEPDNRPLRGEGIEYI